MKKEKGPRINVWMVGLISLLILILIAGCTTTSAGTVSASVSQDPSNSEPDTPLPPLPTETEISCDWSQRVCVDTSNIVPIENMDELEELIFNCIVRFGSSDQNLVKTSKDQIPLAIPFEIDESGHFYTIEIRGQTAADPNYEVKYTPYTSFETVVYTLNDGDYSVWVIGQITMGEGFETLLNEVVHHSMALNLVQEERDGRNDDAVATQAKLALEEILSSEKNPVQIHREQTNPTDILNQPAKAGDAQGTYEEQCFSEFCFDMNRVAKIFVAAPQKHREYVEKCAETENPDIFEFTDITVERSPLGKGQGLHIVSPYGGEGPTKGLSIIKIGETLSDLGLIHLTRYHECAHATQFEFNHVVAAENNQPEEGMNWYNNFMVASRKTYSEGDPTLRLILEAPAYWVECREAGEEGLTMYLTLCSNWEGSFQEELVYETETWDQWSNEVLNFTQKWGILSTN